ncbi:MAG TPA: hypothetical protein VND98_01005 [Solirubrobacterales bacterium]|nr:hypothetical protein [Solirubrobacterales bacterium]
MRRNWQRIAALYFPGAVIVARSAFETKPATDGSLFLDIGSARIRREPLRLPRLIIVRAWFCHADLACSSGFWSG